MKTYMKNIINFLLMLLALVSFSCNDRLPGGLIGEWDSEQRSKFEGHDAVDLGLPSGTWWSTCNLGGTSPTVEGHYFEYKWTKDSITSPSLMSL